MVLQKQLTAHAFNITFLTACFKALSGILLLNAESLHCYAL